MLMFVACTVQLESRAVRVQQQCCSVGNVSRISQGHSDSALDDNSQQKVDKSLISYESVSVFAALAGVALAVMCCPSVRHVRVLCVQTSKHIFKLFFTLYIW